MAAAEPLWSEADRRYSQAEREQAVAAAYELRDRAAAEIPYLAAWLARPLPASASRPTRLDAEINTGLLPLVHANRSFAALLAAGGPPGAEPMAESTQLAEQSRLGSRAVGAIRSACSATNAAAC